MSSGLIKGSEILKASKSKKPVKLTRSQTAKQAARSIRSKYGSVSSSAKYYHRGAGNWIMYDPKKDSKHTSKNARTTMPKNYSRNAHKMDVRGVDTRQGNKKAMVTRRVARSPKENTVDKLKRMGGKEWQGGSHHRIYIPNRVLHDMYGLKITYYKTGNISSASVDGEKISNSSAYKLRFGDAWYNVKTGQFETKGMSPDVKSKVIPKLKKKL